MKIAWLPLATALLLTACAAKEVLEVRSADVPAGVNLGGQWRLRAESNETNRRLFKAGTAAVGGQQELLSRKQRSKSRKSSDSLVHVFLETGTNLKITQTADGLFVSFDRAIVEEYRFGEYRQVNVGPIAADRASGWEQGAYVIETLDNDGNKLQERYQLADGGALLLRQISIWSRRDLELSLVQSFDRVND